MGGPREVSFMETVGASGWSRGGGVRVLWGQSFSLRRWENSGDGRGDGCTTM